MARPTGIEPVLLGLEAVLYPELRARIIYCIII